MSDLSLTGEAIDSIADLATKAAKHGEVREVFDQPDGRKLVLLNDGTAAFIGESTKDAHGLALDLPTRIKRAVLIQTTDSMVDYLERFKGEGTTLFANIATNRIIALLDYHASPEKIGHAAHFAVLDLPYAEEWKLWKDVDKKLMPQLDFVRFIQENRMDIKAPDGATLLEACRDLSAKRSVNFTAAIALDSDNESFEYSDNTEARTKGGLTVPNEFVLGVPVYFGSRLVELHAYLRNKIDDGKLSLTVALSRAEQVRQAMFREIVEDITTRAGVPVIYGAATFNGSL